MHTQIAKRINLSRIQGFTLLEVIVALLVLAIISVIAVTGLQAVILSHNRTTEVSERLAQLQMARLQMQRDFSQMIGAPLINQAGTQITFMGNGYINPMAAEARSTLQFIEYTLQDAQLVRQTWQTPEQGFELEPSGRILLTEILQLQMNPLTRPITADLSAIEVSITFENRETLVWYFNLEGEDFVLP